MHVKFSSPDITEREIAEVAETLRSGWITTGPRTKLLEKKIAARVGVSCPDEGTPNCVCLNSQTACSEMALRLLGVGPGDEVITSAYTYTASASVIDHVGAKIVLVDTQKDSFEMDYDALSRSITDKTKVIIPVDLGGVPCDYDRIYDIVESKRALFKPANDIQKAIGRVTVLADAAHSFDANYQGRKAGSLADFSAFSFHAVKNMTTAEGGALTWRTISGVEDSAIYKQLQLFSLHGQDKDAFSKNRLGAWEYDIVGTWYKCNMTDVAAALGLVQFERYPEMLAKRHEIIKKYDAALCPLGIKSMPHCTENYTSSGHLYLTRIPGISLEERNEIIIKMAKQGIACNVHYKPLPLHTAYKKLGFDIADYPNAYAQYVNEISLPLHTCLTEEEVDYVIEQFKAIVGGYSRV